MDDRVVHHMKVEHKLVGRATNERELEYKPCARSGATDETDSNRTGSETSASIAQTRGQSNCPLRRNSLSMMNVRPDKQPAMSRVDVLRRSRVIGNTLYKDSNKYRSVSARNQRREKKSQKKSWSDWLFFSRCSGKGFGFTVIALDPIRKLQYLIGQFERDGNQRKEARDASVAPSPEALRNQPSRSFTLSANSSLLTHLVSLYSRLLHLSGLSLINQSLSPPPARSLALVPPSWKHGKSQETQIETSSAEEAVSAVSRHPARDETHSEALLRMTANRWVVREDRASRNP